MALNVKQKYPGTQGGAAQLYASDTRLSLRRREQVFTRLSKSYKENMDISSTSSSSDEEMIVLLHDFLFLPGSVDATWHISSSSLRMYVFVFERPQVVVYCNFSCSRHVSKSLTWRIKPKKRSRGSFFLNDAFTHGVFRVGVHTHIGAL